MSQIEYINQESCLVCTERGLELRSDAEGLSPEAQCACCICQQCFTQYLMQKIGELNFTIDKKIKCPNYDCKHQQSIYSYQQQLNKEHQTQLDEALLHRYYLRTREDLRSCPNTGCRYFGVFDANNACEDAFECELCGMRWREQAQVQASSQKGTIAERIYEFMRRKNDFASHIYEYIVTDSCPRCGVFIYKNGGCLHMQCKRCNFDFCWLCKQEQKQHRDKVCAAHLITKYGVVMYILLGSIHALNLHTYPLSIMSSIALFLMQLLFYNFIVLLLFISQWFLSEYLRLTQREKSQRALSHTELRRKRTNLIFCILFTVLSLLYFGFIYYYDEEIIRFFCFMFKEILLVGLFYGTFIISYNIHETWIIQVR